MIQRLRVLASAYACEPEKGSEPGIGWNLVLQISRFNEVWVITRKSNEDAIRRAGHPLPHVHWSFYDLPVWARFWKRGQRGVHLYYHLWQAGAYLQARRLSRRVRFDLAHHVTFGNYWMPSLLWLLPVPFVWGPVGGGESAPAALWKSFGARARLFERLRAAARSLGESNPLVRLGARRASLALAATPETAARLARLGSREVKTFGNTGLGEEEIERLGSVPVRDDGPLRLVSIGRLLPWKGFHLGLEAFARLLAAFPGSTYGLIGDGPERPLLEALSRRLAIAGAVTFRGRLPRPRVLESMADYDVLVHPSLHDSGGWVCLEAMAAGRPVICLDLGGPAQQVSEETGFAVPAFSREQAVEGLARAMRSLASDAEMRKRMGESARKRAAERFAWSRKGERMRELYARARERI